MIVVPCPSCKKEAQMDNRGGRCTCGYAWVSYEQESIGPDPVVDYDRGEINQEALDRLVAKWRDPDHHKGTDVRKDVLVFMKVIEVLTVVVEQQAGQLKSLEARARLRW